MKTFFTSKTIWFGILQIAFGLVGMGFGFIDQQAGLSLVFTGFGTIGFRTVTTKPLE